MRRVPEARSHTRTAVVVLGMHRSGTSALATLTHRLGARLPRTVMAPAADNPAGFAESTVLVDLADEILAHLGMGWHSLGRVPPEWFESADAERWAERYAEGLRSEFPGDGPVVLKDPRLCRLVPLLASASERAGLDLRFAISLRHPLEVAESLRVRNAWSSERALASWMAHYLAAERGTRDRARAFVSYDSLLEDRDAVADRLERALGPDILGDGFDPDAAGMPLDRSLRHHSHTTLPDRGMAAFEPWIGRCYRALLGLEAGRTDATSELDRVADALAKLESPWLPVIRDLEREAEVERRERAAVQANLSHAEHVISDLEARVSDRDAVADELQRTGDELRAAHRERAKLEADTAELRDGLARANDTIEHLRTLVEDRAAVQAHLRYAEGRLEELEHELASLRASRSMRITRPLRRLGRGARSLRASFRRVLGRGARRVFHATPLPPAVRLRLRRMWTARRERLASEAEAGLRERERDAARAAVSPGMASPIDPAEDPREAYRRQAAAELDAFLAGDERVELPDPGQHPAISVLLVLHNQADLTLACLRSLAASELTDFEVVVVDNHSTDRTRELLDRVGPCTTVLADENLHFLRGANLAAERATGRYLLFLNNDTRVAPDALARALRVFGEEERVGAVGGRLILPDGSLQEAGSIVWSDGSCLGYGRGGEPFDPRWMFRRDVDYCSAAFLMTPRDLFGDLGGLDERFAPAYYEDSDYCLRVRADGYRVLYEPGVLVAHYEFGSSSMGAGAELQRRNQERFVEKHRKLLADHRDPGRQNVLVARSARRRAPKVLCIDDRFPHRAFGSGFPRANDLLHQMVEAGLEVTVYATDQAPEPWDEVYSDIPPTVECLRGNREEGLRGILRERRSHADILFVSRPHNMAAFDRIVEASPEVFGRQRVVYDAEAVFSLREIGERAVLGPPLPRSERKAMLAEEIALAERADAVITVTRRESRYFRACRGRRIVIGHGLEPRPGEAGFEDRSGLLFVGAFHGEDRNPNGDSMRWFVREVWPIIRSDARMRDAHLRIVGREPGPGLRALGREAGVEVVGTVPGTRPWYAAARVCVVPTRFAAGLPYKAHEATAHGVPMVATRLVAGQLGWTHGSDLLAASADDPEAFAEHCIRLHTDPDLWQAIRSSALQRLDEDCSEERNREALLDALGLTESALMGARPWRVAARLGSEATPPAERDSA